MKGVNAMSNRKKAITPFGAVILGSLDAARVPHYKFYEAIGISKVYFYQILCGLPPQAEIMEKIMDMLDTILPPDPDRRTFILDQAAKTKNEIPPDIYDAIRDNPEQWDKIRRLLKKHL